MSWNEIIKKGTLTFEGLVEFGDTTPRSDAFAGLFGTILDGDPKNNISCSTINPKLLK